MVCGTLEEAEVTTEEKELALDLLRNLTYLMDEEGKEALTEIEFYFIGGFVCNKCFLKHYNMRKKLINI